MYHVLIGKMSPDTELKNVWHGSGLIYGVQIKSEHNETESGLDILENYPSGVFGKEQKTQELCFRSQTFHAKNHSKYRDLELNGGKKSMQIEGN